LELAAALSCGPTSSSCGGLQPLAKAVFCLSLGKKRAYYAVLPILGHVWCPVVTLVTFSINPGNFEKNKKN
jgi:hypothetical protein